mmetsp:Transcript_26797/g.82261  ORF Transcript_26797/g.82261 Transcript_26797/m.82261 type:complete len:306 (-) Transcript_26797:1130-2047(-)
MPLILPSNELKSLRSRPRPAGVLSLSALNSSTNAAKISLAISRPNGAESLRSCTSAHNNRTASSCTRVTANDDISMNVGFMPVHFSENSVCAVNSDPSSRGCATAFFTKSFANNTSPLCWCRINTLHSVIFFSIVYASTDLLIFKPSWEESSLRVYNVGHFFCDNIIIIAHNDVAVVVVVPGREDAAAATGGGADGVLGLGGRGVRAALEDAEHEVGERGVEGRDEVGARGGEVGGFGGISDDVEEARRARRAVEVRRPGRRGLRIERPGPLGVAGVRGDELVVAEHDCAGGQEQDSLLSGGGRR